MSMKKNFYMRFYLRSIVNELNQVLKKLINMKNYILKIIYANVDQIGFFQFLDNRLLYFYGWIY